MKNEEGVREVTFNIEDEMEMLAKLQEKYDGNEFFNDLMDAQLAISQLFTLLGRGDYVILSKEEYQKMLESVI